MILIYSWFSSNFRCSTSGLSRSISL